MEKDGDKTYFTKHSLFITQAPHFNFELDADQILEKALESGFVIKVGEDRYLENKLISINMTRQQRRSLERQEKKKSKNDVLPTAQKAVEHHIKDIERRDKINKQIVHLDAEVLDIRQCENNEYLCAVLSRKHKKAYRSESANDHSYFVHYYNIEDGGLHVGKYDLTMKQALKEQERRQKE